MSESKHTPGPWQVVGTPFNEGFTVLAQPHPALRGFTKCVAYVGDKATEENEANARLIAAAPDLFRELDMQVRNCPVCRGEGFAVDVFDILTQEAPYEKKSCGRCASARAVLSKIEGRP